MGDERKNVLLLTVLGMITALLLAAYYILSPESGNPPTHPSHNQSAVRPEKTISTPIINPQTSYPEAEVARISTAVDATPEQRDNIENIIKDFYGQSENGDIAGNEDAFLSELDIRLKSTLTEEQLEKLKINK